MSRAHNTDTVTINGFTVSPRTHAFHNGVPVLNKDGTPRKKLGRPVGSKNGVTQQQQQQQPRRKIVKAKTVQIKSDVVPVPASGDKATKPLPTEEAPVRTGVVRAVSATVARTYGKIGAPETKDETIEIKTFVTPPAQVEIGYGLTLNIGNYESARVDVKVSVPCYREETDAAYEFAKKWAEERIQREIQDVRGMAAAAPKNTF